MVISCGQHYLWTRWGRVGEPGATQLKGPFGASQAGQEFRGKFHDKTGNSFDERASFRAKSGKYELISMAGQQQQQADVKPVLAAAVKGKVKSEPASSAVKVEPGTAVKAEPGTTVKAEPGGAVVKAEPAGPVVSRLDAPTRSFIEFIFSGDMFKAVMSSYNVDVRRMPLGRLSQAQAQRGIDVLEEIEGELLRGGGSHKQLEVLSSKFYQVWRSGQPGMRKPGPFVSRSWFQGPTQESLHALQTYRSGLPRVTSSQGRPSWVYQI